MQEIFSEGGLIRLKSLRKSSAAGVIFLLLILMSSTFIPIANAQRMVETVIFSDDFEGYEVGTFPSSGGWTLVWDGAGSRYQVVTSSHYHSPSKSFQLLGAYGWSSVAEKRFSTAARMIGFEAYMMAESYPQNPVSTHAGVGSVGFWNRDEATWGKYYVTVAFRADGYLVVHFINDAGAEEDIELQPYTPGMWYKVRVVLDRSANTFSVWINDELKASNVKITETNINGLEVSSAWAGVTCYFDDVKVFTVEEKAATPPTLTLYDPQVNGLTVTINGVATPGYSGASISRIHWEWGDGSSEDSPFPASHMYSNAGTYTVTVTAYQSDGLSVTKALQIKVEISPSPAIPTTPSASSPTFLIIFIVILIIFIIIACVVVLVLIGIYLRRRRAPPPPPPPPPPTE